MVSTVPETSESCRRRDSGKEVYGRCEKKKKKKIKKEKSFWVTRLIFKCETRSTLLDFRPRYFAECGSSDTRRSSLVLHLCLAVEII